MIFNVVALLGFLDKLKKFLKTSYIATSMDAANTKNNSISMTQPAIFHKL